jgi:hypothetical protein
VSDGTTIVARLTRRIATEIGGGRRRAKAGVIALPVRVSASVRASIQGAVRLVAAEYPAVLVHAVRKVRLTRVRSTTVARADAVLTARASGWGEAAGRLGAAPGPVGHGGSPGSGMPPSLQRGVAVPLPLTRPVVPRGVALPERLVDRLVVYTAVFGQEQALPPIHVRPTGVRFVCFTDTEIVDSDWEISLVEPAQDPVSERSRHRILAHEVLKTAAPECQWSIYVDPDVLLIGNLHTLVARWLLPNDVAMFRDATAAGWWDLAERHVMQGDVGPEALSGGFAELEHGSVPRTTGAYDPSLIWRHHVDPSVIAEMERWWEHTGRFPGLDGLALAVALAVTTAGPSADRPAALPLSLGQAGDSWFSATVPPSPPPDPSLRRTGSPGRRRTKIAFLRDPVANQEITTFLRGEQLSRLVASRFHDTYDVVYTDDRESLDDHVVILLKQTLQRLTPDEIDHLGRRNIAVVNCWDDQMPDRDRVLAADAQMVLAFGQLVDLRRRFPEHPTFLVTHHVNLDFPSGDPPQDRLRTGYFGASYNTVLPPTLDEMVDLVPTAVLAADDSDSWMPRLLQYNCHWAIRKRQYWDGWKPFMKGFVAARYGAPVIVAADDDDARYYLGDDYPFYATGASDEQLELLLLGVDAAFGGPEWDLARGIMRQVAERSSADQVCADMRRMVEHLAG